MSHSEPHHDALPSRERLPSSFCARFPWERLHRITANEARLASRFSQLLPASTDQRWGHAFERFWTELTGIQSTVECVGLVTSGPGRFQPPEQDFHITQVTFPPALSPGFVVVDRRLVDTWLDAVVGPSEHSRRLVSLSAPDEAVLSYLLMRGAEFLVDRGAPPVQVATHDIDPESAFGRLNRGMNVVEIDLVVSSPAATGLVRIYLPESLTSVMEGWSAQPRRRAGRRAAPVGAVGNVPIGLLASIGYGRYSPIEIATLGPGDIAFPLQHGLERDEGAFLVAPGAAMAARAEVTDGRWSFELLHKKPIPTRGKETMEDSEMATAEEATSELMGSVELRADFVVGGVDMTIADLHEMKPGRIFVVDRQVGQPIDVVVNNHVVARGELVDVDGKLGVRIVALSPR